jgi:mannose-6-phosphate isomerase
MFPLPIEGILKHYAWGSARELAELLRCEPSGEPEAELWLGAHEGGPARLLRAPPGTSAGDLLQLFRERPLELVGNEGIRRGRGRFPFLFKVLAAAEPLSLQAHPDLEQAERGFAAEQARGLDPGGPEANYRDASPKPELLYALKPFSCLCGFCGFEESERRFLEIGLGDDAGPLRTPLEAYRAALGQGEARGREAFFRALFELGAEERASITERMRGALPESGGLFAHLRCAAVKYPNDPGLVVALLMNYLELAPGEALFMPARQLHAYLGGLGLEVMAPSDNVLRGGLTPKKVDVEELVRVLDFGATKPHLVAAVETRAEDGTIVETFPAPVEEFLFSIVTLPSGGLHWVRGPCLCLVLEGELFVQSEGDAPLPLSRGGACLIPFGKGKASLTGPCRVALVSLPAETGA